MNKTRDKRQRSIPYLAVIGVAGAFIPHDVLATDYTIVPGASDWNLGTSWNPSTGTPGSALGDRALVTGAFGGAAGTVEITAPIANPLLGLSLGDTSGTGTTTVQSTGGFSLPLGGATVRSEGNPGAINVIAAPVDLAGGDLTISTNTFSPELTNNLTITGTISANISNSPTGPGLFRQFTNASGRILNLSNIDVSAISSGAVLQIQNSADSRTNLTGVISNSLAGTSTLVLGGTGGTSTFEISNNSTYAGNVTLGASVSSTTHFLINSDQPFGAATAGTLVFGGNGSQINVLEALNTDRTITKNQLTRIFRNLSFQGQFSVAIDTPNLLLSNNPIITNDITASGKVVSLGREGGTLPLNNNATDRNKSHQFTGLGTTIIASNIIDNSSGTAPADSMNGIRLNSAGTLVLTGTNTFQGPARILGVGGTLQLGNGGTSGSMISNNGLTPVVNSTVAGFLTFNRSDNTSTAVTANGPLGIINRGTGSLTLERSQFHSGPNTIGNGIAASTLIVNGGIVPQTTPSAPATVDNGVIVGPTNLTYRTITLSGSDTVEGLGLKPGQPVYLSGSPNTNAYIFSINSSTQVSVYIASAATLPIGIYTDLVFGEGSALGTSTSTTTVSANSTLAGTGQIAGAVTTATGARLAPGANTSGNTGAAGTLTVAGGLSLAAGTNLDFDLASTAAGTSDLIATANDALSFDTLHFTLAGLVPGTLETGIGYHLINAGSGSITGNTANITTTFSGDLAGLYTATYSISNVGGSNYLDVTFAAVPEPGTLGLLGLSAGIGLLLIVRRRRSA